jgi:hypothetical protein
MIRRESGQNGVAEEEVEMEEDGEECEQPLTPRLDARAPDVTEQVDADAEGGRRRGSASPLAWKTWAGVESALGEDGVAVLHDHCDEGEFVEQTISPTIDDDSTSVGLNGDQ